FYTIPWFVLNAFGQSADFWACLAAGSMVQMVATAVPLPGGTGGVESGFALFYGPLFGASATAGYLVWRIVTFFAPTILAAPLLGLRSSNPVSIRHRWDRMMGKYSGTESGNKRSYGGVGMSGARAARLAAKAHKGLFSSAKSESQDKQDKQQSKKS
ncbi:MAG: lysylphosphatidylglycerol synthase domain-containing protein, partial [Atopobium minutum]|nr:lysylphosphatidylglycerol synthase domain-containing protein [Atopobium minutum]